MLSNLNSTNSKVNSSVATDITNIKEDIEELKENVEALSTTVSADTVNADNVNADTMQTRNLEATNLIETPTIDATTVNATTVNASTVIAPTIQGDTEVNGDLDVNGNITAQSATFDDITITNGLSVEGAQLTTPTITGGTITNANTIQGATISGTNVSGRVVNGGTLSSSSTINAVGSIISDSGTIHAGGQGESSFYALDIANHIKDYGDLEVQGSAEIGGSITHTGLLSNSVQIETPKMATAQIFAANSNNNSYNQTILPSMSETDICSVTIPFFTGLLSIKLLDNNQENTYAVINVLTSNTNQDTAFNSDLVCYSEQSLTYINYITQNSDGSWEIGFNGECSQMIVNYMYFANQTEVEAPYYEVNKDIDYDAQVYYFPSSLSKTVVWGDNTNNTGLDVLGQLSATISPTFDNYDFDTITVEKDLYLKDSYNSDTEGWTYSEGTGKEYDYLTTTISDEDGTVIPVWRQGKTSQSDTEMNNFIDLAYNPNLLLRADALKEWSGAIRTSGPAYSFPIVHLGDNTIAHGALAVEATLTANLVATGTAIVSGNLSVDGKINGYGDASIRGTLSTKNLEATNLESDLDGTGFDITADNFIGNLTGNADTATNAINDQNGDEIDTTYQKVSEKGQANGYAELDSSGRIPYTQMPISAVLYKGGWNASTGSYPSTAETGDEYVITTAGTISGEYFYVGDWILYNGTSWDHLLASSIVLGTTDPGTAGGLWYS